jgi:hypothetical protein
MESTCLFVRTNVTTDVAIILKSVPCGRRIGAAVRWMTGNG